MVHEPVPEQFPEVVDHPPKLKPAFGVAVSVTVVPGLKLALHVVPQVIPAGLLVIVPLPEGVWATVSVTWPPLNVAETETFFCTTRVQLFDDPEHAPDHPPKAPPEPGAAESVTLVPLLKLAVHVEPQFMPGGLLVTVPVPEVVTLSCAVDACD